jgi:hypothetical protein
MDLREVWELEGNEVWEMGCVDDEMCGGRSEITIDC